MSAAFRCETCSGFPDWRVERDGDAAITWACADHLHEILVSFQRPYESTTLRLHRWHARRASEIPMSP